LPPRQATSQPDTSSGQNADVSNLDTANPLLGNPNVGATPELDSLTLLASGLLGLGGYAGLRLRSARQRGAGQRLDAEGQDQQA
jgi:hypothetical protein